MKKLMAVGLVMAAMFMSLMAADVELVFWHGVEAPENVKLLNDKIKDFEKTNPGIKVKAMNYGAADQVNGKIMTAVAANTAPDLMWWGNMSTGALARTGKLVKVQDYINKDKAFNAKDIPAGLWGLCKYNGEIYGVPFDANNLAIYYNKKIFKDAGVDPAKIVTWADLRAAAKKLTKQGQYGFQVPQGQGEWLVWTWMTGLWQAGGEFLGDNNTKVKFNSKAGADAIQLWYDMVNVDKSSYFSEPGAGYKPDDFIAGRVAMMINGPWNFPVLEKAKKEAGLDYGAIFLPKNKKNATNLGGENMYIFKSNKTKEDAAWKFSKYIMSPDFQADWSMTAGYLPVSTSTLNNPAYKKFLADNPFIKTYADQVKYGLGRPPIAEYDAISAIVGKSLEKVLYGKQSAKDALDEAAKEATAELE